MPVIFLPSFSMTTGLSTDLGGVGGVTEPATAGRNVTNARP